MSFILTLFVKKSILNTNERLESVYEDRIFKKCITPPLGSPSVGYYKPRVTKGVIDDLYVRAVAFDDGEKKAVCI